MRRALQHHPAEACAPVAYSQLAPPMTLRLAAFRGADLLLDFPPPSIDRIGHRLIHSNLRAQLDPQARTAQRRALAARVGSRASLDLGTYDASMAMRAARLAR